MLARDNYKQQGQEDPTRVHDGRCRRFDIVAVSIEQLHQRKYKSVLSPLIR